MPYIFEEWEDMKEHIERFGHLAELIYMVKGMRIKIQCGEFAHVYEARSPEELEGVVSWLKSRNAKPVSGYVDTMSLFGSDW